MESKIPSISVLVTNSALTAVKNKVTDVSSLVKKTDHNAKIPDIESKYITTAHYNKFIKNIVDNSIKSKEVVNKYDIINFIINTEIDTQAAKFATKAELKAEQDKIIKLQAFD